MEALGTSQREYSSRHIEYFDVPAGSVKLDPVSDGADITLNASGNTPESHIQVVWDPAVEANAGENVTRCAKRTVAMIFDFAARNNVPISSLSIVGQWVPEVDDTESYHVVISQTVDLDVEKAINYWSEISSLVEALAASLSAEESWTIMRDISTEVYWTTD